MVVYKFIIFYLFTVPPIIIEAPGDRNNLNGTNVTFHCLVEAEPTHTIQWLHNDDVIDFESHKYLLSRSMSQLTVVELTFNDAGIYVCIASNVHGISNASATLYVQGNTLELVASYTLSYVSATFSSS